MQTVAQTLGPEALLRYINPTEVIKRLAAAQGIDVLNLIKTEEQLAQEQQQAKKIRSTISCRQLVNLLVPQWLNKHANGSRRTNPTSY